MLTPNERWEQGVDHDPRSVELYKAIERIDWDLNGDYFCWKSGGDGDNGETLMYLLDCHFEERDAARKVSDEDAMDRITAVINGPDYDEEGGESIFDAYERIENIVKETGRQVRE